jgi:hypothetical protein
MASMLNDHSLTVWDDGPRTNFPRAYRFGGPTKARWLSGTKIKLTGPRTICQILLWPSTPMMVVPALGRSAVAFKHHSWFSQRFPSDADLVAVMCTVTAMQLGICHGPHQHISGIKLDLGVLLCLWS